MFCTAHEDNLILKKKKKYFFLYIILWYTACKPSLFMYFF